MSLAPAPATTVGRQAESIQFVTASRVIFAFWREGGDIQPLIMRGPKLENVFTYKSRSDSEGWRRLAGRSSTDLVPSRACMFVVHVVGVPSGRASPSPTLLLRTASAVVWNPPPSHATTVSWGVRWWVVVRTLPPQPAVVTLTT